MKQGWEIKKLGEVSIVFEDGDWIESKDQSIEGVRLIQTGNIGSGFFKDRGEKARYISEDTFKRLRCTEIFEDDCLISRLPDPVGRACVLPNTGEKMITAVDCTIIRFDKNKLMSEWFLLYSLSQEYQNGVNKQVSGATRQRISRKNLGLIEIPLPPLPEQQRIVAILDEAFAAIDKAKANAQQNLQNAKELFESYLQRVFENKGEGWEEKSLGEILVKTETVDPTKKPSEKFIYLDVSSVNKETKEIENATVLMGKDAPSRARKLVRTNDVIFATVRPTHSRVALITEEYDEQVCSTGYFVLRAKDFLNNNFVYYFLLTYSFNKQMEKLQKGASYPAVTDAEVKGIVIPFPKLKKEQQTIVQKLDAINAETKKLESIYQQKINDLEELKKSVLQKAFAGELKTDKVVAV